MKLDKFTVKAQEAISSAQDLARRQEHQAIEPEHLLKALVDQADGIVVPVLQRIGADPNLISGRVDEALGKLPRVSGGENYPSQRFLKVLDRAEDEAKKLKDEYTAKS
jgi:ATP-dependent Clp protease ATP-binding subunit ClpB